MPSQNWKQQAKDERRNGPLTLERTTPERAVAKIYQSYNINHLPNPSAFLENAVKALENYPVEVLHKLADPSKGILTKAKFPPTISELVAEASSYMKKTSKNFV